MTGVITRVLLPRGFGFIRGEDEQEYFFYHAELRGEQWGGNTVCKGKRVEFTPATGDKGLRATDVSILS
jgi:cold shock CspA family protein